MARRYVEILLDRLVLHAHQDHLESRLLPFLRPNLHHPSYFLHLDFELVSPLKYIDFC
jgi:hypothetical protein